MNEAANRILVVDDEPAILQLVAAILRRAGYDVATVTGGEAALEKIESTKYDAILLDLMMPEVDGFEVLKQLELRGKEPACECVVIMSAASQDAIEKARTSNVFGTLRKPFDIPQLLATVEACVAAHHAKTLFTATLPLTSPGSRAAE